MRIILFGVLSETLYYCWRCPIRTSGYLSPFRISRYPSLVSESCRHRHHCCRPGVTTTNQECPAPRSRKRPVSRPNCRPFSSPRRIDSSLFGALAPPRPHKATPTERPRLHSISSYHFAAITTIPSLPAGGDLCEAETLPWLLLATNASGCQWIRQIMQHLFKKQILSLKTTRRLARFCRFHTHHGLRFLWISSLSFPLWRLWCCLCSGGSSHQDGSFLPYNYSSYCGEHHQPQVQTISDVNIYIGWSLTSPYAILENLAQWYMTSLTTSLSPRNHSLWATPQLHFNLELFAFPNRSSSSRRINLSTRRVHFIFFARVREVLGDCSG